MKDDLISRQAATTIPVMPKEHRYYQTNNLDDAYEQGWNDLQECIENLPPIQQNHNADYGKMVGDTISRQAAIDAVYKNDRYTTIGQRLEALPSVQPIITHEQAIDYLRETGWLQNHDRILTESKVPLKGTWKDYTDEGYVECPFCKSATNCESKEDIDDLHFCFSCGAMLKRGEADGQ